MWVHLKAVGKKLLSDGAFGPTRTVSGEGGQFFDIFGMTSTFASELVCPPTQSIQYLNVFGHQKHVVSRPGVWYVVFSPKKL